jgi:cell division protein FtsB
MMKLKLSRLIFFIIMLVFVGNAVGTAINYQEKSAKIEAEKAQIDALKLENIKLKSELKKVKSLRFVEEEARNKLNMSRPNETTIIGE